MRDLEMLIPPTPLQKESNSTPVVQNQTHFDWKKSLAMGLCPNEAQIKSERAWSVMISDLRELCPETIWMSICEDKFEAADFNKISSFHKWLNAIVAQPEWPFPKQVILVASTINGRNFKVLFDKIEFRLPFVSHSADITITPWKDKFSSGWKFVPINTFTVNKAGQA